MERAATRDARAWGSRRPRRCGRSAGARSGCPRRSSASSRAASCITSSRLLVPEARLGPVVGAIPFGLPVADGARAARRPALGRDCPSRPADRDHHGPYRVHRHARTGSSRRSRSTTPPMAGTRPSAKSSRTAIANVVSGLCGGVPVVLSRGVALASWNAGGRTRLVAVYAALALALVLTFGGSLLARVPMAVVAGLLVVLGFALIDSWTTGLVGRLWRKGALREPALLWSIATVVVVALRRSVLRVHAGDRCRLPAVGPPALSRDEALARAERRRRQRAAVAPRLGRRRGGARARGPPADPRRRARGRALLRQRRADERSRRAARGRRRRRRPRFPARHRDRRHRRTPDREHRAPPRGPRNARAARRRDAAGTARRDADRARHVPRSRAQAMVPRRGPGRGVGGAHDPRGAGLR